MCNKLRQYGALTISLAAAVYCTNSFAHCPANLASTTPTARFEPLAQGASMRDTTTGLIWMRCSLGQQWSSAQSRCVAHTSAADYYAFSDALAAAAEPHLGTDNWRLPNKKELASIVEYGCVEPAVNPEVFPQTFTEVYWSSTPQVYASDFAAWAINFNNGSFSQGGLDAAYAVRLVRDAD